jgi:hypothetical protein
MKINKKIPRSEDGEKEKRQKRIVLLRIINGLSVIIGAMGRGRKRHDESVESESHFGSE